MRNIITLAAVAASALAAPAALAAPTITSVAVTGPTGTVWDTTKNSFYTVFIQDGLTVLNPNDNFTGVTLSNPTDGDSSFALAGDGFPVATKIGNSDPFYTLTVKLTEGAANGVLTGTYVPTTGLFTETSKSVLTSSGDYSLTDFNWTRGLNNIVGSYSYTNKTYNKTTSPGSGDDYQGAFTISQTAVPEPATWALMILGFGTVGMALRGRRGSKQNAAIA